MLIAVSAAVVLAVSRADHRRALSLFAEVGGGALCLALLPQLVAVLLEIASWRRALSAVGYRAAFSRLFVIRVASESLSLCLPGGPVFAESMKLPLFAQHAGLGTPQALVAMTLRKYVVLAAQACYLLTAAALLASVRNPEVSRFAALIAVAGGILAVVAAVSRGALGGGKSVRTIARSLERVPLAKLRYALAQNLELLCQSDRDLAAFFRKRRSELSAIALSFASWSAEALETFVFLRLLSCHVGFAEVAAMEATLSLLRSLVVFLPAGIGVQDVGYAFFLRALGVSDAGEVALAFALLKRSKELVWLLGGLALLAPPRRATGSAAAAP